jgi:hypothetical protein
MITTGLYFDLIVWAKNVETELSNGYGRVIYISYLSGSSESIMMWIFKSDSDTAEFAYRFFYDKEKKGVQIININTEYAEDFIITEGHFLNERKELTKAFITKLNVIFKTNGRSDNLNKVELFVKNNKENVAKSEYRREKIHSDYIYFNKEDLIKSIEKETGYFVESVIIKRSNVDKIVAVDSGGCG